MRLVLFCLSFCLALDVGLIGFGCEDSEKLISHLLKRREKSDNRVAVYDGENESLAHDLMHKGAISAFSPEHVVKFAQVVHLCFKDLDYSVLLTEHFKEHNKQFVVWGKEKKGADKALVWGEFNGNVPRLTGEDTVLAGQSLYESRTLCPQQQGYPRFVTETIDSEKLGCDASLAVCRLHVEFESSMDRLHAVSAILDDGSKGLVPKTNDPKGFVKSSAQALPQNNAKPCDSFVTMGTDKASSIVMLDPNFDSEAFAEKGIIVHKAGWFCGNPKSPETKPQTSQKPPNLENSVFVAQFVVRKGYSVGGRLVILGEKENKAQIMKEQPFECFCEEDMLTE